MTARARLRRWNDAIQPSESADLLVEGDVNKFLHVDERQKLAELPGNAELTGLLAGKVAASEKGAANGVATLDGGSKVPAIQLPSYVDDVVEFANLAAFPVTGEAGKIYIAVNGAIPSNPSKQYRWSGSAYTEISPSPGSTDAVPEGSGNLYFTGTRVRDAVLTGLSTASSAVISAADSVLSALGKVQAQISGLASSKFDKAGGEIAGPTRIISALRVSDIGSTSSAIVVDNATGAGYRLRTDPDGSTSIDQLAAGGIYNSTPLRFSSLGGVEYYNRPTLGVSDGSNGFVTYAEAVALVGGGGGGGTFVSFNGRTEGLVTPTAGDYDSSMITHGDVSVSIALAALEFDTLDGGTV